MTRLVPVRWRRREGRKVGELFHATQLLGEWGQRTSGNGWIRRFAEKS